MALPFACSLELDETGAAACVATSLAPRLTAQFEEMISSAVHKNAQLTFSVKNFTLFNSIVSAKRLPQQGVYWGGCWGLSLQATIFAKLP